MYVLGIETSCDETAAAVVKDGRRVLSNVVSSSLQFHRKHGGIIPEIAFRKQLESIVPVVERALQDAGLGIKHIGLVSVTSGPGLLGSLLVGVSFAKALCLSRGIPLIGTNHLYSHIYANFLEGGGGVLPAIALVVSGGHTSLYHVRNADRIVLLGSTRDDACGEAFDKVAKILGLGYPGGPLIERLARHGNAGLVRFSCSDAGSPLDFSFSGIKTAVLYYVRKSSPAGRRIPLRLAEDLSASFQKAVVDALVEKSLSACRLKKIPRLVVGGGVAANGRLREVFRERAAQERVDVRFPPKSLCIDNAAMVAGFGYRLFRSGYRSGLELNAVLKE